MSADDPRVLRLHALAEKHGLRVVEYAEGHYQIEGGTHLVNYWPTSRRQAAYLPGAARALRRVLPSEAIELALGRHVTQRNATSQERTDGEQRPSS